MTVQRSSLLVTGALQLVGVALTLALTTTPLALGATLLAAIGGPLLLLALPASAPRSTPGPGSPPICDVRTRFAALRGPSVEPPAPLPTERQPRLTPKEEERYLPSEKSGS